MVSTCKLLINVVMLNELNETDKLRPKGKQVEFPLDYRSSQTLFLPADKQNLNQQC
jgi:hypothetical protein